MKIRNMSVEMLATIRRRVREVKFQAAAEDAKDGETQGQLIVSDVRYEEIPALLALLEGAAMTAKDGELRADPATTAALAAASPAKAPKPAKAKPAPSEDAEAKGEEKAAPAPAAAPAEAESDAPAAKPAAKANGKASEAPPELVNARKLRDILAYFMKAGITDKDALVAECEKVRVSVPILARIANLDERVGRTLEVMDMGEDNAG